MKNILESESRAGSAPFSMRNPIWDRLVKGAFAGYLVTLTVLLLVKDPVPEGTDGWWKLIGPVAHLASFFLLAALAFACQWPVPGRIILLGLIAYATLTELLQGALGWRSPEWIDWIQDVAGVALGASCVAVWKSIGKGMPEDEIRIMKR